MAGPSGRTASHGGSADQRWRLHTVAILPFLELGQLEGAPFSQPAPEGVLHVRALARRRAGLEAAVSDALAGLDLVRVLGDAGLRAAVGAIPSLAGQALVADERLALGRERWLGLDATDALAQFDVARRLMREAFVDLLAPERYAELALWRGLALMELGQEAEARAAFLETFLHDPARRFTPGWYGAAAERAMHGAIADLTSHPAPEALRFPADRLARLARTLGADHTLTGVVVPRGADDRDGRPQDGAPSRLLLSLRAEGPADAEPADRVLTLSVSPPAAPVDPVTLTTEAKGTLSRWLLAWHTCTLAREDSHPLRWARPDRRDVHVTLSYRHDVWLHHRQTRLGLHGPGVGLSVAWEPAPWLQFWGRFGQVTTLTDPRGDLLSQFGATHVGVGAGLRLGDDVLSASLRLGLSGALTLNDFEATTDIDCKFFGPESPRCAAVFVARAPLVWVGVASGLSVRWNPAPGWHVAGDLMVDAFAGTPTATRELNYPVALSLGVGTSL
jgi:hypothetical protein